MKTRIKSIIDRFISECDNWIHNGDDGLFRFVDPNDDIEISAHYGATHAAASFIMWGRLQNDDYLYEKGVALMDSIIRRWNKSTILPAFHFDFNNFALITALDYVDFDLAERIKQTVLQTSDSNHDTINWLPMRLAVNKKRLEWEADTKYQSVINHCKNTIAKATNADGGIEDRLPHGMSFNLQYDLATVAVMQYLNVRGEKFDLSKQLGFLLNAVSPDGDINYQGRGTNQIFAWGLWVYLLTSSGREEDLSLAIDFLFSRLDVMLNHNSMMLNDWDGKEKFLWWDYHYASVYTSHCLFWLILSIKDYGKYPIIPVSSVTTETGLHIHRTENNFVSWFEGRSEYLSEKGPAISCIWTREHGVICKGTFAPWQGPFGNKYIYEDVVLKNYCGLLSVKRNKDWSKSRFVHKLIPSLESTPSIFLRPIFCPIYVNEIEGNLEIIWNNSDKSDVIFNIPAFSENNSFELYADGEKIALYCVESIKNQYGWVFLHQSHVMRCRTIKMIISK
ncbi:MAG: hypothetical protein UH850_02345 [Paludibacteraceae bacterium]|nr:hypothetical protein [Paludibacteraceae bacterium]